MQGLKTVGLLCAAFACAVAYAAEEEPSAPAQYDFAYAVNDPTTGDQKDQQETRNGDDVSGYYRTLDADGSLRTVKYKSDAVNGFTAEVVREPVAGAVAAPVRAAPAAVVVPKVAVKPAAVVPVVAPAPVVVPAPAVPYAPAAPAAPYYFGSASVYPYSYGYQPYPYSYGYQPYPNAYSPYAYSPYAAVLRK